jgi:hypothetical protein
MKKLALLLLLVPLLVGAQEAFPPDSGGGPDLSSDVEFGGQILKDDGTAAAPSNSYTSEPDTGEYLAASGTLGFSVDEQPSLVIEQDMIQLQDRACLNWSTSQTDASAATDRGLCKTASSSFALEGSLSPNLSNSSSLGSYSTQWRDVWRSSFVAGHQTKTLSEGSATVLGWAGPPPLEGTSAYIYWMAYATDGVDVQTVTGATIWTCVSKTSTPTCGVTNLHANVSRVSVGTFTCTAGTSFRSSYSNNFTLNCTSSLTQTTLQARYHADFSHGFGWTTIE